MNIEISFLCLSDWQKMQGVIAPSVSKPTEKHCALPIGIEADSTHVEENFNTYQTSEPHIVFAPTALLLRTTLKVNLQTQTPQNYHAQGFALCNRTRLETI